MVMSIVYSMLNWSLILVQNLNYFLFIALSLHEKSKYNSVLCHRSSNNFSSESYEQT